MGREGRQEGEGREGRGEGEEKAENLAPTVISKSRRLWRRVEGADQVKMVNRTRRGGCRAR